MITRTDATNYVTTAIEAGAATADEFDVDAIADALYDIAGGWDFTSVDHDEFWAVVVDNAR